MILIAPANLNTKNNYYKTPLKRVNYNKDFRSDFFEHKNIQPSFKGIEKEINLHFPTKEAEELFTQTCKAIVKKTSITEKINLVGKTNKDFHKIMDSTKSWSCEELGQSRFDFINDRAHEIFNPFLHMYNLFRKIELGKLSVTPSEFDNIFINGSKRIVQSIKRYEFFLNKGMEQDSMNPTQVFDMGIDSVKDYAKSKNIKINVAGKKILKNYQNGFNNRRDRVHDYELYTIFSNLAQNSVKYSPKGSIIKASFKEQRINNQKFINFSIEDKGIGIPKEEQAKVIDGQRASNAIASGIEGTGYGLTRVYKTLKTTLSDLKIESPLHPENKEFPGTRMSCLISLND